MKIYIQETKTKDTDGEELIIIQTYESKPNKFKYLLWI